MKKIEDKRLIKLSNMDLIELWDYLDSLPGEEGKMLESALDDVDEYKEVLKEKIIEGIKFLCESPHKLHQSIVEGLEEKECIFEIEDFDYIKELYGEEDSDSLFEGITKGYLSSCVSVLANVRIGEYGWSFCREKLLSVDDRQSLYHAVRVLTDDRTYVKRRVLSNKKM